MPGNYNMSYEISYLISFMWYAWNFIHTNVWASSEPPSYNEMYISTTHHRLILWIYVDYYDMIYVHCELSLLLKCEWITTFL